MELVTERFRMPHSLFLRKMFLLYGRNWLGALAVSVIVLSVLGIFVDLRWAIVALMVVFLVTPMVVAMLYYSIGMRRECAMNVIDHRLLFEPDRIDMEVFRSHDDEEDGDSDVFLMSFSGEDLRGMTIGLDEVFIQIGNTGKGFIWIPRNVFDDDSAFARAVDMLARMLKKTV